MAAERPRAYLVVLMRNCFLLLFLSTVVHSYGYPLFGGRRYLRTVPIRRSGYLPLPLTRQRNEYQLPDYEDGFLSSPQDEYEYNAYEKFPFVQYFGYYPNRDYYHDKTARRSADGYGYFGDQDPLEEVPDEAEKDGLYPYGQEIWYEEEIPRYDSNAEANAAFLQNLIVAQMYQDAKSQYPPGYDSLADDYDDQHWFYGVPTTEVEEKEKVQQYFKNKEDEEVKELESLAKKKSKNKKPKEKDFFRKQSSEYPEKPTKSKSKMTEDEYFDMQKQIIVNGRKNNFAPVPEGLRLAKKQFQEPFESNDNLWHFNRANSRVFRYPEPPTNSIKKLNSDNDGKKGRDLRVGGGKSTTEGPSSTAAPKRPSSAGQKEVVLPRPSNPVRRPFPDISTRSLHEPSVYDTIKKLLNMDKDLQKEKISQPQKRFVLNEDQLTAELNGLKKLSP